MDPEGANYERVAIEDWLSRNQGSPLTGAPLSTRDLTPNRFLREAIEEYAKLHKLIIPSVVDLTAVKKFQAPKAAKQELKESATTAKTIKTAEIAFSLNSTILEQGECLVEACVVPPEGTTRTPADIVCVIDVSGSMGINATVQNDEGGLESNNLSILDIVKHAVKTIIATLQPHDRLGLVSYSTKANRVFGLLVMDEAGKAKAQTDLNTLDADGQTNLWEGLYTGLEILRKEGSTNRLSTVLLLTDGQPNIAPSKGHIVMLQEYRKQYPSMLCTINTFGFGYNLDSTLLRDLCMEGDGMYTFIPDAGFVGTCFVNTMSNILVTLARSLFIEIETAGGAKFVDCPGAMCAEIKEGQKYVIRLGTLQYGQSRNTTFRVKLSAEQALSILTATLRYQYCNSPEVKSIASELTEQKQGDPLAVIAQANRQMFVDRMQHALAQSRHAIAEKTGDELKIGQEEIHELRTKIKGSLAAKVPRVVALLADVEGQVTEAYSKPEWFKKWGIHYLPSLVRAHQLQQCTNFKDPGVQVYGGELFNTVREEADDLFVKLPPPSQKVDSFDWGAWGDAGAAPPAAAAAVDMRMYYNRGGGCFGGACPILLADGTSKRVDEVVKGDWVATAQGPAEVRCVVEMLCENSTMKMNQVGEALLLTPYHPVYFRGEWKFPCELTPTESVPCHSVFNFVLSRVHTVIVGELPCVTLGHGLTDNAVVRHAYLGTLRVVRDLQALRGGVSFAKGFIRFGPNCLLRNEADQICQFDADCQL